MPKFAPDTATRAVRNLRRRCSRAAIASRRGSSVRSAGASAISARKMSRTSVRLRWIAGTRMCDGLSCASWTISSARSVSTAAMPLLLQVLVEADLLGGHRFDLDHLGRAGGPDQVGDDPVRLLGIGGPVHDPAPGGDVRLELLQQLRQPGHHVGLDGGAGCPAAPPSPASRRPPGPAWPGWWTSRARGCGAAARWPARCWAAFGNDSVPRSGDSGGDRGRRRPAHRHAQEGRAHAGFSLVEARIVARCTVRVPVRDPAQPAADVHQARRVAGRADLGAGGQHVADLVGQHRRRGVGVLQRERAAEPAAHVTLRQLDQVDALAPPAAATAACRRPAASAASGRSGGR